MSALSPRQFFLLDEACKPIKEAFGWNVYHVGTSAERGEYRDVDVRLILSDKKHDRLTKAIGSIGVAFLGLAIGEYLASRTGLPIDFQIQRTTEANQIHGRPKIRNPLGVRLLGNYMGDATPAQAQVALAKKLEDMVPGITEAALKVNAEAAARPKRKGVIGGISQDSEEVR